jgi:hypothetical protein
MSRPRIMIVGMFMVVAIVATNVGSFLAGRRMEQAAVRGDRNVQITPNSTPDTPRPSTHASTKVWLHRDAHLYHALSCRWADARYGGKIVDLVDARRIAGPCIACRQDAPSR